MYAATLACLLKDCIFLSNVKHFKTWFLSVSLKKSALSLKTFENFALMSWSVRSLKVGFMMLPRLRRWRSPVLSVSFFFSSLSAVLPSELLCLLKTSAAAYLLMQPRLEARVFGAESSKRVPQPRFQVFHVCRIEEANGKALLALPQVTLELFLVHFFKFCCYCRLERLEAFSKGLLIRSRSCVCLKTPPAASVSALQLSSALDFHRLPTSVSYSCLIVEEAFFSVKYSKAPDSSSRWESQPRPLGQFIESIKFEVCVWRSSQEVGGSLCESWFRCDRFFGRNGNRCLKNDKIFVFAIYNDSLRGT